MKYKTNFVFLILFATIIFISCDDTLITDIRIPEENVSYSEHIQPIFNSYCNNSGCHNTQDRAAQIVLTSYGELLASPFLVIPWSPDESLLILSIEGSTVNPMPPPDGPTLPLTDNQIRGIRVWVEEGAEAN